MTKFESKNLHALQKLCRIELPSEEFEKLLENLSSIVAYFDQLQEVDTENIPPCNHVLESVYNVMREDEVKERLERDTFLQNSPSYVGGMIRVPPVIQF